MDDDPPRPDAETPPVADAGEERADLRRVAAANADATWGDGIDAPAPRVPGVLSGEVGPKGVVSAQLRELSRGERDARGQVPRGASAPGGFLFLLLPLLAIALLLFVVVALMGWAAR